MEDSQVEDGTKGLRAGPRSVVEGCRFDGAAPPPTGILDQAASTRCPLGEWLPTHAQPPMHWDERCTQCAAARGQKRFHTPRSKATHVPLDLECALTFRIVPMASLLTIAEVAKRTGRRACLRSRRGRAAVFAGWAARRGAQWIAPLSTSAATPQTARKDHCPKGWSEIG